MKCPFCGFDNISGADLCAHCGADLGGLDLLEERTGTIARHFHEVQLADLNPAKPIILPPDATVADAVEKMRRNRHGAAFIVEGGVLTGIFTERDALKKLALGDQPLDAVKLNDVMTRNPDCLTMEAKLGQALNMMAVSDYRHVPVVDDEKHPVGFVSVRGALAYLHTHVLD